MNPPAIRDATVAFRVPLDLRADVERLAELRDVDLTTIGRLALREYTDRELHGMPGSLAGGRLFRPGPGRARGSDPPTAKAAARLVAPRAGSQRRRALELIAQAGDAGMTTDEVIAELEANARRNDHTPPAVNGVARRVTDLLQAGAIRGQTVEVDDDKVAYLGRLRPVTRPTRHGVDASVYVLTELGRGWLKNTKEPRP